MMQNGEYKWTEEELDKLCIEVQEFIDEWDVVRHMRKI